MRCFEKTIIVVGLAAAFVGIAVHTPIPVRVEDTLAFQVLVDILAFSEKMSTVCEMLAMHRWCAYPGRLPLPTSIMVKVPAGMEIAKIKLNDIDCVLIKPEEFLKRNDRGPAAVIYHGGGWVFGDIDTYLPFLIDVAQETGLLVMSPEYRRAPEHPFPIPFEDCLNTTIEFMKKADEFNVDPKKIVLAGDSAGGNLAMAVTVALVKMQESEPSIYKPSMQVLIYPKLQMHNYLLPSYRQNRELVFSEDLIPKFWLAYIGLQSRLDLGAVICENGHIDYTDKELMKKIDFVDEKNVPEQYKKRVYDATPATLPANVKKRLDKKTQQYLQTMFLDERVAPLMVSNITLSKLPDTHILVCEYDPLRDDGVLLFERMRSMSMKVTLQHLPNSLHAAISLGPMHKSLYHAKQNSILFKKIKDHFQ